MTTISNKIHQRNRNISNITFLAITIVLFSVFFIKNSTFSNADNLYSPNYNIQMATVNIGGGSSTSSGYILNQTVGQTAQGQFDSAGFIVRAGFQYVLPKMAFTFRISNLDINFGTLVAETPSTQANTLTVNTGSAYGYSVKVLEDHALKLLSGATTIPNTSCDVGLPCTTTDATPWTVNTNYGLGYNMSGAGVDTTDFVNGKYFRPFPVQGVDSPAIVMSQSGIATNSASTVTYKVNISGSQAAGIYQNNIQYIAIPAF